MVFLRRMGANAYIGDPVTLSSGRKVYEIYDDTLIS